MELLGPPYLAIASHDRRWRVLMDEGESDRHADVGGEQVQLVTADYLAVWSREAEAMAVQFVGGEKPLHIPLH
jgi:hypothetical protein